MAAVFAFLGMLLISMLVALLAALQFGDFFGTGGEFVLVIVVVAGFVAVSLGVFALIYATTRRAEPITWAAWALAIAAFVPAGLPPLIEAISGRSSNPSTVGIEEVYIRLELVVPALLAVLVQWGLVRRRWLRSAGQDELTRWPWITITLAGLVILNPYGLAFLQGTLRRGAGGDFMWEFTATVTGAVLGGLLVMAWIECYIRERMLSRRLAANSQQSRGDGPGEFVQEASDAGPR